MGGVRGGGGRGEVVGVGGGGSRRVCAEFVRRQTVGSRLGIDEIGGRATELQKLEINCRRHTVGH